MLATFSKADQDLIMAGGMDDKQRVEMSADCTSRACIRTRLRLAQMGTSGKEAWMDRDNYASAEDRRKSYNPRSPPCSTPTKSTNSSLENPGIASGVPTRTVNILRHDSPASAALQRNRQLPAYPRRRPQS